MKTFTDYKEVPIGFYIFRAYYESKGELCDHICLKAKDTEWFDHVQVPMYSHWVTRDAFADFWSWTEENLPVYLYPNNIKAS